MTAFAAFACKMNLSINSNSDSYSSYSKDKIIDKADFVEETDLLFMMYLDGDNNLNNVSWYNVVLAQYGLANADSSKISVVVLIDGNTQKCTNPIGDGKSHLLKLGAYSQNEYEITGGELNTNNSEYISENTKDYSSDVNWIYEKNYEVDMSSGDTLYNFLYWAKKHFQAEKTILVLQNHGGGPFDELTTSISSSRTLCWDDTTGNKKYLSTSDVTAAINQTFGKIDMLVEDVCLQCSIEEVYGLRNAVNYLVASPNTTYGPTYNYDKVIPFASKDSQEVVDIGKKFIDYNYDKCKNLTLYTGSEDLNKPSCMELSLTLVDCSQAEVLEDIKTQTSQLAHAIMESEERDKLLQHIGILKRNNSVFFYGFLFSGSYVYTNDLGVLCYLLKNEEDTAVSAIAENLLSDLSSIIVYAWSGGKLHNWYYSGDSSYGELDFLKIPSEGSCPWGISITAARLKTTNTYGITKYGNSLENYASWTEFAKNNSWAHLLSIYKND